MEFGLSPSLEQIYDMWKTDSNISDELDIEVLRVSNLHSKYLNILSESRSKRRAYELERRKIISHLRDYYSGLATEEVLSIISREQYRGPKILKSELNDTIELDAGVINLDVKKAVCLEKETILTDIIRAINNRGFHIKSAIDWRKFTSGS